MIGSGRPAAGRWTVSRPLAVKIVRGLLSLGLAITLFVIVIPREAGGRWTQVASVLAAVGSVHLLELCALWATGLLAHSTTLAAAMPTLGRRRALILSLTGSAVANVLPFGGAAGVALNYRMSRQWGFDANSFGVYTVVTNLWDVLLRLSLPAAALAGLLLTGNFAVSRFLRTATVATAGLIVVSLAFTALVISGRLTELVATALDRAVRAGMRVLGQERDVRVASTLMRLRADTNQLVRRAWPQLTFGVVAYAGLLACLLYACLHFAGAGVTAPAIFAGLALERVVTLVPITPGGAGVVEVVLSGLLITLGGDPVATVAGVLLYRAFTYGLEIPAGGAGILTWLWWQRHSRQRVGSAV